jgi:phosphatidylserine/phosphatidylglycerophosphate/cardiolipin synthase-like enzyme
MSDSIRRIETTHIDEVKRTATASTQWFAEKLNAANNPTHPITHNNKLRFFVCGEESFADIAKEISEAKESIDLCCWGFDPGMELVRGQSGTWPRGETFGDLLIAAGKRFVKVRLLVWFDALACGAARNMPGHSHGTIPRLGNSGNVANISAQHSLALARAGWNKPQPYKKGQNNAPIQEDEVPMLAREEYCHSWYQAALHGLLKGIEVRKRNGSAASIKASLKNERNQPAALSEAELERTGMVHLGTHHQKPILIDFAFETGQKAVGYVMGLNSVTDYWDTAAHKLEDPRREAGGKTAAEECVQRQKCRQLADCDQANRCVWLDQCVHLKNLATSEGPASRKRCTALSACSQPAKCKSLTACVQAFRPGFISMKPYQDYACRIGGGQSLIALYNNFVTAWDRAIDDRTHAAAGACVSKNPSLACHAAPSELQRAARPGDSTVQIVRTQPEENDKSIKDIYTLAASKAALAGGYLYIENQYFQYEEWAQHLMETRKKVIAGWKAGSAKAGKSMEDMPVMHVFIVIPVPEKSEMIPRTYDTLAKFGQQDGMTGQGQLINYANGETYPVMRDEFGVSTGLRAPIPEVVQHANSIDKPNVMTLENTFGLKVSVAMLQTCGLDQNLWRYREVYIHSKLLLVDDGFLTLGSANLNQRSMAVDSEINIATDDPNHARDLRRRVWMQHSGGLISGGNGTRVEIVEAFGKWKTLMNANKTKKLEKSESAGDKRMTGFLVPLEDNRKSTIRLG